jgi:LPXTG-site transpeptidase (sortase) family protein
MRPMLSLSAFKDQQRIINILTEWLDLLLIVLSVVIVGIVALYYNVFLIELQDILWFSPQGVAVVQSYEATTQAKKHQYIEHWLQNVEEIFSLLDPIQWTRWAPWLYEYSMDNFLMNNLGAYDLPFDTVPPWRFLVIPSIWVQAPIIDVPFASEEKVINGDFVDELRQGIVKYPNTTLPGRVWNTLLFGHSSVDMLQARNEPYGHVFYRLPRMQAWDIIQVVWDGEIFEYEVVERSILWPRDVPDAVNQTVDKDVLILMACYPLMSDAQRILITALPRT